MRKPRMKDMLGGGIRLEKHGDDIIAVEYKPGPEKRKKRDKHAQDI